MRVWFLLYPDMNLQKRTQQSTTRYRTALYLRLSREDGDKTESDSIANQRTLLEAYAADHPELCIVDEFVDDGYSGSNFERPAFQNLFRELEQAQQEPYRVRRIERQIRQLTAEKAHTQGIKEKLYGDYAEEILTREDFLNYNELYSKRIEEYERKITELEAEQQNLQTAPNAYPFLDVYRKYRKLEEITRPMVVELIEKIEVYEGNRVEITFRFHDEIADLLEELHQKQMGQREVSA